MKLIVLIFSGLMATAPLVANQDEVRITCQLVFKEDGDVLLDYEGHLYEVVAWHSKSCECDLVFDTDD